MTTFQDESEAFEAFTSLTVADSKALPEGAVLVSVDGEIRVLWGLGADLGVAWYTIDEQSLVDIFGDNWSNYIADSMTTEGSFVAKYGDYFWGAIEEVQLTSDSPWDDLRDRAFDTFGYVSGYDDPEVRRVILQGYLEKWTANEFLGNYQQTAYFNSLTDLQREFNVLSEAEQEQRISDTAISLVNNYRSIWGREIEGGTENEFIRDFAFKIASGQDTLDSWLYQETRNAEKDNTTPAYAALINLQQEAGSAVNEYENLVKSVEDNWRLWLGPVNMDTNFATRWAGQLQTGQASEADLISHLKEIGSARWGNKPTEIPWADWAAPFKGQISGLLELGTVDDGDSLLNNILSNGLTGQDAEIAIRHDERFKGTNTMFGELSTVVADLGRRMGFIAS